VLHHWSRLLGICRSFITIGPVVDRGGTLFFRLDHGPGRRHGFHRRFPRLRGAARCGGFETGIGQPGHDTDKNSELDRNKIRNFQVHFAKRLKATDKMTENQKQLFHQSAEIFSETVPHNNLKIWDVSFPACYSRKLLRSRQLNQPVQGVANA
jgi:hypothetical protein